MATKKKCTLCEDVVEPRGTYMHVKNKHPEYIDKWEEVKDDLFEDVEVEEERRNGREGDSPRDVIEYQGEMYTPEDLIFTFGLEGVHILMRKELEEALNNCPAKLSSKAKNWIIDQFDRFEHYKQYPEALFTLLQSYGGVSPRVVQDIVSKVFSIPQKYQKIIELAMQTNPLLFAPPMQPQQPTFIYYGQNQQQWSWQPVQPVQQPVQQMQIQQPAQPNWYAQLTQQAQNLMQKPQLPVSIQQQPQQAGMLTRDDILKILEEREKKLLEIIEEKEKKKEEERYEKLLEAVNKLRGELEELKKQKERKRKKVNQATWKR